MLNTPVQSIGFKDKKMIATTTLHKNIILPIMKMVFTFIFDNSEVSAMYFEIAVEIPPLEML